MSIDEKIERAVERIRATWGVCVAVGGVWVLVALPLWYIIPFIVLAIITYFGSLYLAGIWLAHTLDEGETVGTEEPEAPEEKEVAVSSVSLEVGTVVKTSAAIGRYMDQHIFDWIEITEPSGPVRYEFENVTPRDTVGNMLLPREEGFACYNGVTYKKAST